MCAWYFTLYEMILCVVSSTLSHLKPFNWFTESEIFQRKSELDSKINMNNNKDTIFLCIHIQLNLELWFGQIISRFNFLGFFWSIFSIIVIWITGFYCWKYAKGNFIEFDERIGKKIKFIDEKFANNIGISVARQLTNNIHIWTHKIKLHKMYSSFFFFGVRWFAVKCRSLSILEIRQFNETYRKTKPF